MPMAGAEDRPHGNEVDCDLLLRLPAEEASLPRLRNEVGHWLATTTPASRDEQHDILLAAWEACANAIEHPLGPLDKEIGLELGFRSGWISIAVQDSGLWLERGASPHKQSLGIRLIETLMDSVEVSRSGEGTVVVMRLRLDEDRDESRRRSGPCVDPAPAPPPLRD